MQIDLTTYRKTFFDEVVDHSAALEAALLRLDGGAVDRDAVAQAFRAAHSVKGGADAVGFPHIATFTHTLESLLDQFRASGRVPRRVLDLLLEATDTLARLVGAARAGEATPSGTDELLARLAGEKSAPGAAPAPRAYTVAVAPHPDALRNGLDPVPLLRELAALGTVGRVELSAPLPALADLDPERCYLAWTVHLETDRPAGDIADVFAFAPDMIRATVTPVEPPAPARPGPSRGRPPPTPRPPRWGHRSSCPRSAGCRSRTRSGSQPSW